MAVLEVKNIKKEFKFKGNRTNAKFWLRSDCLFISPSDKHCHFLVEKPLTKA